MACNLESYAWCEANNAAALKDLVENEGVIAQVLPTEVVEALKEKATEVLAAGAAADPVTAKVHDAYMAFKAEHAGWADVSLKPLFSL
jgi:TRAP-type mannitol/chloroaromatic compound transport system substrate-binding protein